MKFKNVLIVGLGSVALKYLVLLKESKIDIVSKSKRYKLNNTNHNYVEHNLKKSYDLIIISSATQNHIADLLKYLEFSSLFLVEKPLSHNQKNLKNPKLLQHKDKKIYVSSPLKFLSNYNNFNSESFKFGEDAKLKIVCHSWLPSWRHKRNLAEGYWADKNQGGITRDLVHEINYVNSIWQEPKFVRGTLEIGHAKLRVPVDTKANFIFTYNHYLKVNFSFDYFAPKIERYAFMIEGSNYLVWDIQNKILTQKQGKLTKTKIESVDNPLKEQLKCIATNDKRLTTLVEGTNDVKLIDKVLRNSVYLDA